MPDRRATLKRDGAPSGKTSDSRMSVASGKSRRESFPAAIRTTVASAERAIHQQA